MPRLASVDEANLVLDHAGQVNVFLVAGVLSVGGFVGSDGVPDLPALRAASASGSRQCRSFALCAVEDRRRHRWEEAPPNLDDHIRLVGAVPGRAGLERLCGELMAVPLPIDRPMWEMLLVPGASGVGVGVVLRIHHALADGMAAVAIVQQLFDPSDAPAPSAPPPWAVESAKPARMAQSILERVGFGLPPHPDDPERS